MINISGYFKLAVLSDEVRQKNKIRSQNRLDCTAYAGEYMGLKNFVNTKGQLFFYKTPCKEFIKADLKRRAEWSLTNNSLNFSSIYTELPIKKYGFGYPNKRQKLSNGQPNPLIPFKNDGYLFLINDDYTEIEIFVVKDGRNFISQYYQCLIDGEYEKDFDHWRSEAKLFFQYEG